ncbi:DUF3048 domain-containing protein [Saccharopolyspora cebuensis]|uniref:DUF3048 domain-containing protein n=1 Tax=Saccharopolyspora cebuensis TaxID=418759 RepID=A0ABV4CF73_9PSEU
MWRLRVLGVLIAALVLVLAGLAGQPTGVQPARTAIRAAEEPPEAPPPPPPGPPVLAVKIDNAPAGRPPTGLEAADLVHVEPVEAGISRLIGVFASEIPPVVGPVRSARQTDLRLLGQYGRPALAFSGAAPELLPEIHRAPVVAASPREVPGAFYRGAGRPPHDLYVRTGRLPAGQPWSPRFPLVFGAAPPGGVPTEAHEVRYRAARIGFGWTEAERGWRVSMDGEPYATADGTPVLASTVVLQHVRVTGSRIQDVGGNVSPFAETVGTGRAVVLRDGRAFEGTWSRPAPDAGTTYRSPAGEVLPFAPGQVWVVLVPAG